MADKPLTPPPTAPPDRALRRPLAALAAVDPDIAAAVARIGLPPVRGVEPGFPGLLRIVMGQQISVAAARAIRTRLERAVNPMTAEGFLAQPEVTLRAIGLSRQKAAYGRGIARAAAVGAIDFDALGRMDDEAAIAALVALPGIGRWTAEIYLLFALGRADVWPAGDLAMRAGLQRLKRLRKPLDEKRTRKLGKAWRPHRSAAARFLWHFYSHAGV
jgi:DNA-3-methyladenine glycosylase II